MSEYRFEKGKGKKEVVMASRMAGLKQPIYELLAVTFQDFSFYNEFYVLAGTKYINPIADNALKTYNYKILDTVKTESGHSILIYFKPKERQETLGIEGVLYIDTKSFALTKAIAELKGMINVKATQNYSYIKPNNIWFPQEMDVVLKKGDNNERISLFGGSIKFGESKKNDSIVTTKTKSESDVTYFISKATNTNIEINTPIVVKSNAPAIQFNDDAAKKKEGFWDSYRTDSITERGKNTYKMLDSIVKVEGDDIEKKINIARNMLKGIYPIPEQADFLSRQFGA
ncbi:MAG: carboxypeptidase-like regulatory domain-containing protein, partial [Lutibacter sp.]|nr:carboxypeptidase-like regulatory domain-containing protein [Lutibacter sp.]